jgi:FKBP-type peptidyl-prolyl cis-trans isomerase
MRYQLISTALILLITLNFGACKKSGSSGVKEGNIGDDASYALGMSIGASLKNDGITPNLNEFVLGMRHMLNGEKARFTEEEAMIKFQEAYYAMKRINDDELLQKENEFMAENSKKPGINITPSGLQYEVIFEGSGDRPGAEDVVKVHYEGKLTNGSVFDSSYADGEPIEFPLNIVISGWTEGLQLMRVGSKYRFYIPSELGYGVNGAGPIPPYSVLIFEVELFDIIK